MARRGESIELKGLPKQLRRQFRRAVFLDGAPSVSAWLSRMVRRTILEQEAKHGNLLNALTPDERDILKVIKAGANDPEYIASETMLAPSRLAPILADLVERGLVETRRQGGKTEQARGARRLLYFITEKYQSKLD
jgi:DNA-binding MarR family transcriptional regulator